MTRVRLDVIVFDAGTQIRHSISEAMVAEYAASMTDGATFPPVVVFHDGNHYYMADGFHRGLAAKRNGFRDIEAEVTPGTKTDALWFALGANKANGQRLNEADKKCAILLALQAWPERSSTQLGEQIGCTDAYVGRIRTEVHTSMNLPDRVTGKDGKSYPASRPREHPKQQARGDGRSLDRSPAVVQQRRDQMRDMAAQGHSSRQIAAAVGFSEGGCRHAMRAAGIEVPADRATGRAHRHDATRIVEHIVMDAENLTADTHLIDFSSLDKASVEGWVSSLITARHALNAFIRRLSKEAGANVEAA